MTDLSIDVMPYQNSDLPTPERVEDLLRRMSVEEKVGQLTQYFYFPVPANLPADFDPASLPEEQRAYVQQPQMVHDSVLSGRAGSVLFVNDAASTNRLQKVAVDQGPHGIPLMFGFDVIHGLRTAFPVPIALAATWDVQVAEAAQGIAAKEARAVGIHWSFAPMIDVTRDPRWGRIIEGNGEDPYLGSAMAAAQVRGFQGNLDDEHVYAGPKHFVGYGAAPGGRDYDGVEISDSELRNVYLPPFKAAIDAGARNIMSAYMDLNGTPASGNEHLLEDVLRGELEFTGWVVSDANGVRNLEVQHFAEDFADAAVRALTAGNDMEMAIFDAAFVTLPESVRSGRIDEAVIDRSVRRVLAAKFELGLFENPYVAEDAVAAVLDAPSHRDASRAAAERSIVLLKNDEAVLPLRAESLSSVVVIGELADSKRDTIGPWMFNHDTAETVTILEGLRSQWAGKVDVAYVPGPAIPERVVPSPFDRMDSTIPVASSSDEDAARIDEAVQAAAAAEAAIVVIGQRQNQVGESASTDTLEFPGRQLELLRAVAATGTPVVVVVMSGRPLDLRWADDNVAAIVQAWYPGTRGGEAVARILAGEVSPAGRLPFTWPRHVGQVPMFYAHNRSHRPDSQDARYIFEPSTPLYAFGHGLSYGRFEYANLSVDAGVVGVGDTVTVSVDVTNVSGTTADEVAQLYIHQRYGSSSRPVRELKGFERVSIEAGSTKTISFTLGAPELSYWSSATQSWIQDRTVFDVWVGGSSTAELATSFRVS